MADTDTDTPRSSASDLPSATASAFADSPMDPHNPWSSGNTPMLANAQLSTPTAPNGSSTPSGHSPASRPDAPLYLPSRGDYSVPFIATADIPLPSPTFRTMGGPVLGTPLSVTTPPSDDPWKTYPTPAQIGGVVTRSSAHQPAPPNTMVSVVWESHGPHSLPDDMMDPFADPQQQQQNSRAQRNQSRSPDRQPALVGGAGDNASAQSIASGVSGGVTPQDSARGGSSSAMSHSPPPPVPVARNDQQQRPHRQQQASASELTGANAPIGLEEDYSWLADMPTTIIKIAPEKGGTIFKHVNYLVSVIPTALGSTTATSLVTRRYSDFLWLHEHLTRRFPFRLVVNMPPKKVNGTYADSVFLERRRRALQRYTTHIVRHPILAADPVVKMFFSLQDDIATYRKLHSVDSSPEAPTDTSAAAADGDAPSSPAPTSASTKQIDEYLTHLSTQLEPLFHRYQRMVDGLERVAVKQHEMGKELMDVATVMHEMGTQRPHCFSSACTSCARIMDHAGHVAMRMEGLADAHDSHSETTQQGSIESLKLLRDQCAALELLLQRTVKAMATHQGNISALARKITATDTRLASLGDPPGPTADGSPVSDPNAATRAKHEASRQTDLAALAVQRNAVRYVTRCLDEELRTWHRQGTMYALAVQLWVKELGVGVAGVEEVVSEMMGLVVVPEGAVGYLGVGRGRRGGN